MLSKHVSSNQRDWDVCLPLLLFHYRTAKQSSTGKSPFELLFGREARLPIDVQTGIDLPEPQATTEYVEQLKERQASLKELVDARVTGAQYRQTETYNRTASSPCQYAAGDLVWLYTPAVGVGL